MRWCLWRPLGLGPCGHQQTPMECKSVAQHSKEMAFAETLKHAFSLRGEGRLHRCLGNTSHLFLSFLSIKTYFQSPRALLSVRRWAGHIPRALEP